MNNCLAFFEKVIDKFGHQEKNLARSVKHPSLAKQFFCFDVAHSADRSIEASGSEATVSEIMHEALFHYISDTGSMYIPTTADKPIEIKPDA